MKNRNKNVEPTKLAQYNARVPENLVEDAHAIAAKLRWSKAEFAEVALASLLGKKDAVIEAKKQRVQEVAKEWGMDTNFIKAGRRTPSRFALAA